MHALRKNFINISSTNLIPIVNLLITIVLTPYILHKIGTSQYGIWVVLNSMVAYLSLSGLGFNTKIFRDMSCEAETEINKTVNSFFFLILFVQVLLCPLIISAYFWLKIFIKPETMHLYTMGSISFYLLYFTFLFKIIGQVFETIFYSMSKHYVVNSVIILSRILNFLLIILIGSYQLNVVILSFIGLGLSIVCMAVIYLKSKNVIAFTISYKYFDKQYIKTSLMPSLQYFMISIGALIIFQSDTLVISSFVGVSSVTAYSLGYRLVSIPQMMLWNFSDVLFPRISKLYSNSSWIELSVLLKKIFAIVIPLNIVLTIILYFFGTNLLKIWVGEEHVIAKDIFDIFIITFFSYTIAHTCGVIINAMGKQKIVSYIVMLESFINLIISLILVRKMGMLGVALGTLSAHLCTTGWFMIYYVCKNLKEVSEQEINNLTSNPILPTTN